MRIRSGSGGYGISGYLFSRALASLLLGGGGGWWSNTICVILVGGITDNLAKIEFKNFTWSSSWFGHP